jgi:anti-sigma regulatory factor (Ser/Thr protein kinase)
VNLRGAREPLVLTREQVRDALAGRTAGWRVDDTEIVAVELVTNALRHTESGPTGMGVDVYEDTAMIWVHDGDKDVDAVRPRAQAGTASVDLREDGRGLPLVAALASRWLVWPTSDGKAVVAEIDLVEKASGVPAPRSPEP